MRQRKNIPTLHRRRCARRRCTSAHFEHDAAFANRLANRARGRRVRSVRRGRTAAEHGQWSSRSAYRLCTGHARGAHSPLSTNVAQGSQVTTCSHARLALVRHPQKTAPARPTVDPLGSAMHTGKMRTTVEMNYAHSQKHKDIHNVCPLLRNYKKQDDKI